MPIGVVSCPQGDKFSLQRGFVRAVAIGGSSIHTMVYSDNFAEMHITVPFVHTYYFEFEQKVWDWSSNHYSLDFFMVQAYYVIPPSPVQNPAPVTLYLSPLPGVNFWALLVGVFGYLMDFDPHLMPPPAPGYWLGA